MPKDDRKHSLDYLVEEYMNYNILNEKTIKECEVRFGTKKQIHISKLNFENVISKLQSCGFTSSNENGENLMRITLDHTDKAIENMRLELNGEHVIQDYCKNENINISLKKYSDFININKKYYPKKQGLKYKPYNNDDFGFRLAFQLEETIEQDNIIVQNNLISNFVNISKFYRYINRIEYTHPDFPFKCHMSIVKNSKQSAQNIKRSGVLSNSLHYEIEIEFVNDDAIILTRDELIKKLKILIKYILCGLQDTRYPITFNEINNVKKDYIELFGIETSYDDMKPNDFIGYSSKTLKLSNIQEEAFENDINIRNNYTVTEKADGMRKLLYINSKGCIYMIDTQFNVQYSGMHTDVKDIYNSVLDGEHIKYDKNGNLINLFASFDIYIFNKIDKREELFITTNKEGKKIGRLPLLEKIIKSIKMKPGVNVKPGSFLLECKRFYTDEGSNIFKNCGIILQREKDGLFKYNIDGLIFNPANKPIPINNKRITWDYSLKWKPPQYNTIDFLIRTEKNNGKEIEKYTQGTNPYKTVHLYCGFGGGYIDPLNDVLNYNKKMYQTDYEKNKKKREINKYKPVLFVPTHPYDENAYKCNIEMTYDSNGSLKLLTEENEIINDNTIVEFRYDNTENRVNFQWKPLRIRYDKTQQLRDGHNNFGNDYTTANNNWNTIHNPITDIMITTGLNIPEDVLDDVYYNRVSTSTSTRSLRDFHNLVVKNILINSTTKKDDILMDFAVGKGGDMPKWIKSELSFVYGVDVMRDNIENKKDGACARFLNYAVREKKIPEMIFTMGNSSENIRSGDAFHEDPKYKIINDAIFGKGSHDKTKMGNNLFKNYGIGKDGFNVTSCQFALHYFFENNTTLENFISNVVECTKLGGYFIGTSYDGNKLFNMLTEIEKDESITLRDNDNKLMWELTKKYNKNEFNNDSSCIGYPVDVYQESINKTFTEFLVNYEYFNALMNTYGFILVNKEEIEIMGLPTSSGLFSDLYKLMKNDYNISSQYKLGTSLNMSDNEKTISFLNRYFVYKKVRKYTGNIEIIKLKENSDNSSETIIISEDKNKSESDEFEDENDKNEKNENNEES